MQLCCPQGPVQQGWVSAPEGMLPPTRACGLVLLHTKLARLLQDADRSGADQPSASSPPGVHSPWLG